MSGWLMQAIYPGTSPETPKTVEMWAVWVSDQAAAAGALAEAAGVSDLPSATLCDLSDDDMRSLGLTEEGQVARVRCIFQRRGAGFLHVSSLEGEARAGRVAAVPKQGGMQVEELNAENDGQTLMFERRGPTYTDYGSDAPRQRLRAKWWLATGGALVASILAFVLFRLW